MFGIKYTPKSDIVNENCYCVINAVRKSGKMYDSFLSREEKPGQRRMAFSRSLRMHDPHEAPCHGIRNPR
jgi:hypothetical protein